MKLMRRLQKRQKGNRGFSLIEIIIVIAIMAILVGIIGAQVVPYINKTRIGKDQQILSSFLTDGVSAFSLNAEKVTAGDQIKLTFDASSHEVTVAGGSQPADPVVIATFKELCAADAGSGKIKVSLSSREGTAITTITITNEEYNVTLVTDATIDELYQTGAELMSSK